MSANVNFFCLFSVFICLGTSYSRAEIFAQQYGATVLVWMDDEAEMNWVKIHQEKSQLIIEGFGTVNLFVPIFETREKFSASTVQDIIVVGSEVADTVVNETYFPMQAYGNSGSDMLVGGFADDELYGGDDEDGLFGRDGRDRLYGEGSADLLQGGKGNDYLDLGGQSEEHSVHGEGGRDTFVRYGTRTKGGFLPLQVNYAAEAGEIDLGFFDLFHDIAPFSWDALATDYDASQGDFIEFKSIN
jgi:Ca2+-binding RTX toxin-like protein